MITMNREDRTEMRELMTDIISSHTENVNGKFEVIKTELGAIKAQTTKTNGRVNSIEYEIEELKLNDKTHLLSCPNTKRIVLLENQEISRNSIKDFLNNSWVKTVAAIGVIIALIEIGIKLIWQ